MLKVKAVKCLACGDVIFSRARHDDRSCSCGAVGVDGGFDYCRVSFAGEEPPIFELEIEPGKEELYRDWSTGADLYGRIPGKGVEP